MPFRPRVGDQLTINGTTYIIAEHPATLGIPCGRAGRRAIVYQVVADRDKRVFHVSVAASAPPVLILVAQSVGWVEAKLKPNIQATIGSISSIGSIGFIG